MAKMLNENNEAFQEAVSKDFETTSEENSLRLRLLLGPDFPEMVRKFRRNLEEERGGVVQGLFQRVSQVTRAGQSNLAAIKSPKL
jgi:hypothetical protein